MAIRALLIGLTVMLASPAFADDSWSIYQHDMGVQFGEPAVGPPPVTVQPIWEPAPAAPAYNPYAPSDPQSETGDPWNINSPQPNCLGNVGGLC
jgi:hypothetical protein